MPQNAVHHGDSRPERNTKRSSRSCSQPRPVTGMLWPRRLCRPLGREQNQQQWQRQQQQKKQHMQYQQRHGRHRGPPRPRATWRQRCAASRSGSGSGQCQRTGGTPPGSRNHHRRRGRRRAAARQLACATTRATSASTPAEDARLPRSRGPRPLGRHGASSEKPVIRRLALFTWYLFRRENSDLVVRGLI